MKKAMMIRECCVCGQIHCDELDPDTMYVKTKRKSELWFSEKMF